MQGLACKAAFFTIALYSMSSLALATGRVTTSAGCMGCHQGETITSSNNDTADKSGISESSKDKKQIASREITEGDELPG